MMITHNIAVTQIQHYLIVASSDMQFGCLNCIKKRMLDNKFIKPDQCMHVKLNPDVMDEAITNSIIEEVKKSSGEIYYLYNLYSKVLFKGIFLKYPQCEECGETESADRLREMEIVSDYDILTDGYRAKDFDELIKTIDRYLSSLVHMDIGWFKNHYRSISDSLPMISLDGYLGKVNYDSYGRKFTYKQAYYTAILEGLERHQGGAPSMRSEWIVNEQNLSNQKKSFLSLKRFIHYTEDHYNSLHFPFPKYKTDDVIIWRSVYSLSQQCDTMVPEQIIYFNNHRFYKRKMEERYLPDSSNGVAMGSNMIEAALSGLFEIIERDAFMVHWFSRSTPVKLENLEDVNNLNIKLMLCYLEYFGYSIHVFDITLESEVPTYWVLAELNDFSNPQKLAFYTSAGANVDPFKAIESALIEITTSVKAFLIYKQVKYKDKNIDEMIKDYYQVEFLEDHLMLFSSPKMKDALSFALNSSKKADAAQSLAERAGKWVYSNQKQLLHDIIETMKLYHKDILQANLTSPSLHRLGLNCVKIIVPTMQSIYFGYRQQNINKMRIKQAVLINKLDGNTDELNPVPHPFP
ncbi:YcaO-like family protein [Paenibacillus sp. TSA_86.1]|uniref:YcaO-like family protein n=1 Tax=Paenibacillus sp. TSA_86.1 TaxID=3415649 RepID=UPI0040461148